jgi:hypothetical protein
MCSLVGTFCPEDGSSSPREMVIDMSDYTAPYRRKRRRKASNCEILFRVILRMGHVMAQLVEALRYKSEGRGFDSRWCYWYFSLT